MKLVGLVNVIKISSGCRCDAGFLRILGGKNRTKRLNVAHSSERIWAGVALVVSLDLFRAIYLRFSEKDENFAENRAIIARGVEIPMKLDVDFDKNAVWSEKRG